MSIPFDINYRIMCNNYRIMRNNYRIMCNNYRIMCNNYRIMCNNVALCVITSHYVITSHCNNYRYV